MIVGIVQARLGSRRLPGKVLAPVLGRPMLALLLERARRTQRLDRVIVATSQDAADDPIAELCGRVGVACARGSRDDVLDRVRNAALAAGAAHVVRLTGDCPLLDPAIVDRVVDAHLASGHDVTTNARPGERTFPDGLDVEVVTAEALEAAWSEARRPSQREHVTPFLYAHPERFRIGRVRSDVDLSGHRWTVDEAVDLELVRAVYGALYPSNPDFGTDDVLAFLEAHPDVARGNAHVPTNEGLARSVAEEEAEEGPA